MVSTNIPDLLNLQVLQLYNQCVFETIFAKSFFFNFSAKGTLSEDTIRLFLRQLGKIFILR